MTVSPEMAARLNAIAKKRHPGSRHTIGIRRTGISRFRLCYICDAHVSTFCGKWPETMASVRACEDHLEMHADELKRQSQSEVTGS